MRLADDGVLLVSSTPSKRCVELSVEEHDVDVAMVLIIIVVDDPVPVAAWDAIEANVGTDLVPVKPIDDPEPGVLTAPGVPVDEALFAGPSEEAVAISDVGVPDAGERKELARGVTEVEILLFELESLAIDVSKPANEP